MSAAAPGPLLVVGAGIAGVTTALEAAEAGQDVVVVEREPSVGGRVLRHHQYFPKLCPPSCGMEINTRRLTKNPRVRVLVRSRVASAERSGAGWRVTLRRGAEHVTDACTACGACSKACPATVADLQDYRGDLRALVGSFGPILRRFAFGEDDRPLDLSDEVKKFRLSRPNNLLFDLQVKWMLLD